MFESDTFSARLFKVPGKGGWTFAPVPAGCAPELSHAWGRSPVTATVDGLTWDTSVWKDTKSGRTLLAVPSRIRRGKGDGDRVQVRIRLRGI